MKLRKCFKHAVDMVIHSKLRSWLTIIGIVIGVASVVAIVSLGEGMQQQITSQLGDLGGDIITVTAGFSRGGSMFGGGNPPGESGSKSGATTEKVVLNNMDLQTIRGVPNIAYIDSQIKGSADVSYMGANGSVSLTGVDQRVWAHLTTDTLSEGRFLDSADQNVIVIGEKLATSYFTNQVGINKMISVEGSSYRVVGIVKDGGNQIYMPLSMAYQVLEDKTSGVYDSLVIKVKDESLLDETIISMENKLMMTRHVNTKTKDFSITSSKQMQETRSEMMSTMSTFLLAIAAVSLLVGAVGIANTMFTSVLEKTKEIGIMKALGARNKDILTIFLLNAASIGFIGGMFGVILGAILSGLIPTLLGSELSARMTTIISLNSLLLAIIVSVGVGILAGVIPAYRASKLNPVDALRSE